PDLEREFLYHVTKTEKEVGIVVPSVSPEGFEKGGVLHFRVVGVEQLKVAVADTIVCNERTPGVVDLKVRGRFPSFAAIEVTHLQLAKLLQPVIRRDHIRISKENPVIPRHRLTGVLHRRTLIEVSAPLIELLCGVAEDILVRITCTELVHERTRL